jgi:hypothetical protein
MYPEKRKEPVMTIEETVRLMIEQKVAQAVADIVGEHQRGEHDDPISGSPYPCAVDVCPLCRYAEDMRVKYAIWIRDAADDMVFVQKPAVSSQKQRPIISVAVGEVL